MLVGVVPCGWASRLTMIANECLHFALNLPLSTLDRRTLLETFVAVLYKLVLSLLALLEGKLSDPSNKVTFRYQLLLLLLYITLLNRHARGPVPPLSDP